jgi:hypothetical protein
VGVASFDAFENRFLTLSIQDIAAFGPEDIILLNEFDTNVSNAILFNLTALDVFTAASPELQLLLARRNSAFGNYANIPPPLLPYRLSGGAPTQVPEYPPTDEMSRVHTVVAGAKVNLLVTPNFLNTLGPIAIDEAEFIPPDPLEDKVFIDSSTYDVNSTRKVVTMLSYEFSDLPYFFGTVGGISVGNVRGGLLITVIGDHFQPSGFAVARFTEIESWVAYYSTLYYMNKTHAYFYTPKVPGGAAMYMQLSNNGHIFSQAPAKSVDISVADDDFAFYEIASRKPLSGSSAGRTGVIMRGSFLQRMVKFNALCIFGSCDDAEVRTRTLWSEELGAAVCFSPPITKCSDLYIATIFRVMVGYEVLFEDVWFYVIDRGPTILQAQFDPFMRSIIVQLRSSTNVGNYIKAESCAKLFTIQSQSFILSSTVIFWPQPFTFVLLLDPSHKLRYNSTLEISNGGDVTDVVDKSLTLAGAIQFLAPEYIALPTPVLVCPLYSLSTNDILISAHHSHGLLLPGISFAWNVSISSYFGFSDSLNYTVLDDNAVRVSARSFLSIACPPVSSGAMIQVVTHLSLFLNESIKNSANCSKFKSVRDAIQSNATMCVLSPHVSTMCISKVLLPCPGSSLKVYIDRQFNASFRVSSDSEVSFRSVVTDPLKNAPFFVRWKLTATKSPLLHPALQSFCSNSNSSVEEGANSKVPVFQWINSSISMVGPIDDRCLKGGDGLNVIFSGSEDDRSFNINLPFDFRWLSKTFNGDVFVGSNSYVTFGGQSASHESLTGNNPNFPTLFIGSADNSLQRLMSGYDSRGWRVRFEGNPGVSGSIGNVSIVWELLIKSSGGLELCTGEFVTRPSSISAFSDGVQSFVEKYVLKPNSFYKFESLLFNPSIYPPNSCDLNEFLSSQSALAFSGPVFFLPRNLLPPGPYVLTASLSTISNCSWVNSTVRSSTSNSDVADGDFLLGEDARILSDTNTSNHRCLEELVHSDSVALQIVDIHRSPVTLINGAISSGSPVFMESGSLLCLQLENISTCRITEPTAFSESLNPKDPEFEDLQLRFKKVVAKTRQFLSSTAIDLIVLNSSDFLRSFCSRCNQMISPDIVTYVDSLFGMVDASNTSTPDFDDDDDTSAAFEVFQASNVSYSLEQVCFQQHIALNETHFAKSCHLFLNATRSKVMKYLNESDPRGFSLRPNVLSVKSIFICQYNQSYFNILHKDPSIYSSRLHPLYIAQWSCVIRPDMGSSSGYYSRSPDDTPCSNFTASPYYPAAVFFDILNSSMVARISCTIRSPSISWFLPVESVMVLYPSPQMSVLTQQRIPVNPSVRVLTPFNVEIQRAHLLRKSNTSSSFVTMTSSPVSEFNFASDVRWESHVSWLQDISNSLADSTFGSSGFVLASQFSVPSSLLSLGFCYVFRVSHFFRGQLSGFSEIVVNMSSPFFPGKVSVSQLPSGHFRILTHRIEVEDEERPLQFSFLQSLDFDVTLQPMEFMQAYSGPLYNSLEPDFVCTVIALIQTASSIVIRSNVSVLLSFDSIPYIQDVDATLNQFRLGASNFFLSSLMMLQTHQIMLLDLRRSSASNQDSNSVEQVEILFEKSFLEPVVQLMAVQYFFVQEDHQIFVSKLNAIDFGKILKPNSTVESLNVAVPGVTGVEHTAAVLYEGFRAFSNGSLPSVYICNRIVKIVSLLVEMNLPFSSISSSALFSIITRCVDADVKELLEMMDMLEKDISSSPGAGVITPNSTNTFFGYSTALPSSTAAFSSNVSSPSATSSQSVSPASTPAGTSSVDGGIRVVTDLSNPIQRKALSSLGSLNGTCYSRVGAVQNDLADNSKTYSVVPTDGDPSTWNVVFQSTLIVSSFNLSVYRYFSQGSNRPPGIARVDPEYMSNAFGPSWSDSDAIVAADVSNSTRISGSWGGTFLTAIFKVFDQPAIRSPNLALVELGWILLDESKLFDSANRTDTEFLTFPFNNTWNVTQAQLDRQIAPYRCHYSISLPDASSTIPVFSNLSEAPSFSTPVSSHFVNPSATSSQSMSPASTPAGTSSVDGGIRVVTDLSNPIQRKALSSLGSLNGTCYSRVGAVQNDLADNSKTYSVVPTDGDPSTWNVVFQSTLIVSSFNLSVYRYFSQGSNRPPGIARVDPEYMSNAFGPSWSDSDAIVAADVSNSTRISGSWGGTFLTAIFKVFDQPAIRSPNLALVELGWILLDESKLFDSANRTDTEFLTFPFNNTWNVTQAQLDRQIAPYRCHYSISLPDASSTVPGPFVSNLMRPSVDVRLFKNLHHFGKRHLMQQSSSQQLRNDILLLSNSVYQSSLADFDNICNRMRASSSLSGAPLSFSYAGSVIFSRNFYTRSGVSMDIPSVSLQGVTCSSVVVQVRSVIPVDPSLDFHRSSMCVGITMKDVAPTASTVGGTYGSSRIRFVQTRSSWLFFFFFSDDFCSSSCFIFYKLQLAAYDYSKGVIRSTVSMSYFTFSSVWARTKDSKGEF